MAIEIEPGRRVCVVGYGFSNGIHEHTTVTRVTRTMIVTGNGRRFRRETGGSIPYEPYGGTRFSITCQRKASQS